MLGRLAASAWTGIQNTRIVEEAGAAASAGQETSAAAASAKATTQARKRRKLIKRPAAAKPHAPAEAAAMPDPPAEVEAPPAANAKVESASPFLHSCALPLKLEQVREQFLNTKDRNPKDRCGHVPPRYEVDWERPLGAGSYGRVFGGIEPRTKTPVAIKLMLEQEDRPVQYQYTAEETRRCVALAGHPNIVKLLDIEIARMPFEAPADPFPEVGSSSLVSLDLGSWCSRSFFFGCRGDLGTGEAGRPRGPGGVLGGSWALALGPRAPQVNFSDSARPGVVLGRLLALGPSGERGGVGGRRGGVLGLRS